MKEEDRRDQAGERLIFYIQRTSDNGEQSSENSLGTVLEHQRTTVKASKLSPVETKGKSITKILKKWLNKKRTEKKNEKNDHNKMKRWSSEEREVTKEETSREEGRSNEETSREEGRSNEETSRSDEDPRGFVN